MPEWTLHFFIVFFLEITKKKLNFANVLYNF